MNLSSASDTTFLEQNFDNLYENLKECSAMVQEGWDSPGASKQQGALLLAYEIVDIQKAMFMDRIRLRSREIHNNPAIRDDALAELIGVISGASQKLVEVSGEITACIKPCELINGLLHAIPASDPVKCSKYY